MKSIPNGLPAPPRVVAIIPARGGSKGIPLKNLETVGGMSLVARAVRCARAARSIDAVFVSTDDLEIARAAAEAGARVIDRPAGPSSDEASSEAALIHALDVLADEGLVPDVTVFLQCTSPFTTAPDVEAAVAAVIDGGADVAFTAARSHHFVWREATDGSVVGVNHDASSRPRRQDRPVEWIENGAVYAMRTAGFRGAAHRFFGRMVIVEMPSAQSIEIDDVDDLALARQLALPLDRSARAARIAGIRALVLDFDGVLTDNGVWTAPDGMEAVRSDRSDGLGIERLRGAGLPMLVISKERSPVVAARCAKLGLDVVQGCDDKVAALGQWLTALGIAPGATGYVGNDINDLPCMEHVGCAIAVADAHPAVLDAAHVVLHRSGGRGAVRELADALLDQWGVD